MDAETMVVDTPPVEELLRRKVPKEILEVVLRFVDLQQAEYDLLEQNPQLLDPTVVSALRYVAIRSNAANDALTAYRLHRKSEILACCIELGGVREFYRMLNDADLCREFFIRIGPPPGFDESFYDQLERSYANGDTLRNNLELQVKATLALQEPKRVSKVATDLDIVQFVRWLPQKYICGLVRPQASTPTFPLMGSLGLTAFSAGVVEHIQSQHVQRQILLNEFTHQQAGIKRMFNWLFSMLPVQRSALISEAIQEVIGLQRETVFKEVMTHRQMIMAVPELMHVHLLLHNDAQLLFELFINVALGRENQFMVPTHLVQTKITSPVAGNVTISHILEAILSSYNALPDSMDVTQRAAWIAVQESATVMFPPCTLFFEWLLEDSVLHRTICYEQPLLAQIHEQRKSFKEFQLPFLLYRTRVLQLFLLRLIEQCLQETVPPTVAAKTKKRKRK